VPASDQLSNREARWLALHAQGLDISRRPVTSRPKARLAGLLDQLGTIQLDAVNVVARTQLLVPFSRVGPYEPADLVGMTGPGGRWFEYWGHAASLLPVELYPLFGWRREHHRADLIGSTSYRAYRREWRRTHAAYLRSVLEEVRQRGPLTAGQLSDPRRRDGEWWERRSDGRLALEVLFDHGDVVAWRSPNFERVYDLAERVVPSSILDLPVPSAPDAQRELLARAALALGVATVADLADYFWLKPAAAAPLVNELVEGGRLMQVRVEGWRQPGYVLPGVSPRFPRRTHATLLSPFDSLIWRRERTERLFGFRYRIEIYVPAPRRTYGYYVLPLLVGDELAGRFDLKADRTASSLRVVGAYAEPGANGPTLAEGAALELDGLRQWLGLEKLAVGRRGNLPTVLRRARVGPHSG
jgi:hypothetical protein